MTKKKLLPSVHPACWKPNPDRKITAAQKRSASVAQTTMVAGHPIALDALWSGSLAKYRPAAETANL